MRRIFYMDLMYKRRKKLRQFFCFVLLPMLSFIVWFSHYTTKPKFEKIWSLRVSWRSTTYSVTPLLFCITRRCALLHSPPHRAFHDHKGHSFLEMKIYIFSFRMLEGISRIFLAFGCGGGEGTRGERSSPVVTTSEGPGGPGAGGPESPVPVPDGPRFPF